MAYVAPGRFDRERMLEVIRLLELALADCYRGLRALDHCSDEAGGPAIPLKSRQS